MILSTGRNCSLPSISSMLYSPATTLYSRGFGLMEAEETDLNHHSQQIRYLYPDHCKDQPDDAVGCSHYVGAIDDGSSTDVREITLLIRAQLKRNLRGVKISQKMPINLDVISNLFWMFAAEQLLTCHLHLPGSAFWPPTTLSSTL